MKNIFFLIVASSFFVSCSTKNLEETPAPLSPRIPNIQKSDQDILNLKQEELSMLTDKARKNIEMRKLDNGLEVYAIRKTDIPMVSVMIAVKNGAFVETPDIDGLAHLYEHMFFKANEKISSQTEFLETLEEMGIDLGSHSNAFTSTESVRYFITVQSRFLERGVQFMADAVITPAFLEDELKKEVEVVLSEYDGYEANPQQVFYQMDILKGLFSKYFSRKNVIGSRDVIKKASQEQMREIQRRFYIPNNSALFVAGDFEPKELFRYVENSFSKWTPGPQPFEENPIPEHPPLTEDKKILKEAEVNTTTVVKAFQGPSLVADNKGTIVFDLVGLMTGLESNRFRKELVNSGVATSAYFFSWSQRQTSPLFFAVETTPDKAQEARDKLNALIGDMAQGGFFTERELQNAKNSVNTRSAYDREIVSRYALGLASVWTSTGSLDYYLDYIPGVESVTLADVDQYLKLYLADKASVEGALVPKGSQTIQLGAKTAVGE